MNLQQKNFQILKQSLESAFFQKFTQVKGRWESRKTLEVLPEIPEWNWFKIKKEVLNLHQAYTRTGARFSHDENPIHNNLGGYQFYYLPRNFYRVYHVLKNLPLQTNQTFFSSTLFHKPGKTNSLELSWIDLGCGSGAFSLAVLAWLMELSENQKKPLKITITLVDQGSALMELARLNLETFARESGYSINLDFRLFPDGVERFLATVPQKNQYSLIGSAMMLNELQILGSRRSTTRALRITRPLEGLLKKGGLVVMIEPGTRKGYMNLMAIRDNLEKWPIAFPCPHRKPCPLMDRRISRWCHSTLRLPLQFFYDQSLKLEGKIQFKMRELNASGLVLQAVESEKLQMPFIHQKGSRVLSAPLPKKTGKRKTDITDLEKVLLICDHSGNTREIPVPDKVDHNRGDWLPPIGSKN